MAILFSKNSGLNDDFWKPVGQVLQSVMNDLDSEKGQYDKFVADVFNEKTSKKYAEKTATLTSIGNMTITGEGDAAPIDDIHEAEPKLIVHSTFQNGFSCTKEMKDDGDIDVMKAASQNLVRSYKRTRAQLASDALVTEGAAFTFSGKSLDKTTGDGAGLFATNHAGNQSNVFTNAFSQQMLVRVANIGRNYRNVSGNVQGYTFDTIIIPSNCYALEEEIRKIIRSELQPGTNNNDINTQKGLWNLIVDPCWQVADNSAPYIVMSKEANKELQAAMFYDRTPLDVANWVDNPTRNLQWTGYARMSAGFRDWRFAILGGAKVGTTLS